MRVGDIVVTPGKNGPYQGMYALVVSTTKNIADVVCDKWLLSYEKKELKVVGKIRAGKTYKPGRGADANRFQQFDIIIGDRIKTADVIISDSYYRLADLRRAAWTANETWFK